MKSIKILTLELVFILIAFCSSLLSAQQNTKVSHTKGLDTQYLLYSREAEIFQLEGDFEKAILLFEKSLAHSKKIADSKKECDSLLKIGLMHWNLGQMNKSADIYKSALFLSEKSNLKNQEEQAEKAIKIYELYTEGKRFRNSGHHQKSIQSFQKAIDIAKQYGSQEHELKCLRQQSITHLELNELKNFHLLNEEAIKIARSINHKKEETRCLINLGLFFQKIDNYSKALNLYEDALIISYELNNIEETSACLNNMGLIYRIIGDYDKSLEYLNEALEIDQRLEDDVYISMDLNNIGATYRLKGLLTEQKENFDKALAYYQDSLTLAKKTNYQKLETKILNNIGSVYTHLENPQKALEYFQTAYKKAEEVHDVEAMGMTLNNIGIVYYNQGNYEESVRFNQKAIDLALEMEGGQFLWEAYLEIAKTYTKQNKFKQALESYKNSIGIIEDIRSQIKLEELRAHFLGTDKRMEAYNHLIGLLVTLHKAEPEIGYDIEAFNYLERAKARAFLDHLETSQVNISLGIDVELINQEKEIQKDISAIYTKLLDTEITPEEKNAILEQLKKKEYEHEALKREIRTESPAYANLKYPKIITLVETQNKLIDSKTAFFAYSIGKENSFAFVITKKRLKIFPIPSQDVIQKLTSEYLNIITDKENDDFRLGYELFNRLVNPGLSDNIKKIIFVTDDILHFLPFETLITYENRRKWLIEDFKIAYVPSISSLREIIEQKMANRAKRKKDLLALGDPIFGSLETEDNGNDIFQNFYSSNAFGFYRLKYSSTEIEKISSLFKQTKRTTFRRENASEERIKNHNLKDYKIIHFATHSIIDDKKPARSSIVLSLDDDPEEDGFLQMREIYNLKLNTDLVTLSACQTGLGQFIKGEGIEGLNRAFFYAGSSSVLMSLWPINDQVTAQLMERFYTHLRSSESIMNSLRKTKLEMAASVNVSHPYYWAGFVASGMADRVIFPGSMNRWLLFTIAFLFAGGLVLILKRRQKS